MSRMTRRQFGRSIGVSSLMSQGSFLPSHLSELVQTSPAADSPHIGNLYPFAQKQADRSPLELSFLQARFPDLKSWQNTARTRVL